MSVFGGVKMTVFFLYLEVSEVTFIRKHMRQSCLGCIVEVFCVVGMQKMQIVTLKYRFYLCVAWGMYVHRVKRVVFSMFGDLGGDFCKDTYEAK